MQNLPSNIYNGGAVQFNSTPATQFYLQSMYRKRAKEEALDNYFRNYLSSVNPNGLRPQDIEGWYGRFNQLKDFYNRNAQAIKNPALDRGKAFNEYLGIAKNMEGYAAASKGAGQLTSQYVAPLVTNPDKRTRMTDNDMSMIHAHDLPLDHPEHQMFDPSSFEFDPKDFDISAQKKLYDFATKGVKMSSTIANETVNPRTKSRTVTYENTYSPQDLQEIGSRYSNAYLHDRSFKNSIDDVIHNDPNAYEKYNALFKGIYGKDMQSNEDLAAAYGLSQVQQKTTTQKSTGFNPYSPADYEAFREKYFDYTKNGEIENANAAVDELVDKQVAAAADKLSNLWYAGAPATLPADPATLKALNVENLVLSADKQHIIPTWHDANGNLAQGTPMTIDDYKAAMGKRNVGAKYFKKKETAPQGSNSQTTGKSYQFKGKTYSHSQIENAAKQSGMTVDEYLKAAGIK